MMWEWHMLGIGGSGWWIVGPIMMIVFWGSLFWLVAKLIGTRAQPAGGDAGISAKQIAARRFAAGEIDEAEYTRIINLLED